MKDSRAIISIRDHGPGVPVRRRSPRSSSRSTGSKATVAVPAAASGWAWRSPAGPSSCTRDRSRRGMPTPGCWLRSNCRLEGEHRGGGFPVLGLFVVALSRGIPGGWKRLAIVGSPVGASKYCAGAQCWHSGPGAESPWLFTIAPIGAKNNSATSRFGLEGPALVRMLGTHRLTQGDSYAMMRTWASVPHYSLFWTAERWRFAFRDCWRTTCCALFRKDRPATR